MEFVNLTKKDVQGMVFEAMEKITPIPWLGSVAEAVKSTDVTEKYADLGMPPPFTEWVGERTMGQLAEYPWEVANTKYQTGVTVHEDDLYLDKTGKVQMRVNQLESRLNHLDADLFFERMVAGEAGVCYDGQFFYDADHVSRNSGTQSNDIACDISTYNASLHGTTTDPSPEEAKVATFNVILALLKLKDDQGKVCNSGVRNFMVQCPVSLMPAFSAALNNTVLEHGVQNNLLKTGWKIGLEPDPRLDIAGWTTKFAVHCVDHPAKPFVNQTLRMPRIQILGEGSTFTVQNGRIAVFIDVWKKIHFLSWRASALGTLT